MYYNGTICLAVAFDVDMSNLSILQINKLFRQSDESEKWPICGRYNATERAMRRLRKIRREYGFTMTNLEYALALDAEISKIVNGEV